MTDTNYKISKFLQIKKTTGQTQAHKQIRLSK